MLADILHKIAYEEQKEKGEHIYSVRPSLAGPERCIRQMVYWGLGTPREALPGRTVFVFDDSSWHEELTADWLRKSAYKLHSQQMEIKIAKIEFPFYMKGHIDGILTDLIEKDFLLEHKAINHFTFGMYEKGEVFPLDNISQTCLYLLGLLQIQPKLSDAILLIKNKNTAQYLEYGIHYSAEKDIATLEYMMSSTDCKRVELGLDFPDILKNCFDKFGKVETYISNKEIPPRQYERSDWQCSYCPYSEICWQGWQDEIEQMESDVALEQEFETMANYYLELGMHLKEMHKEQDELKHKIKTRMKEQNVKEGTAGKYIIKLSVREKKEFVSPATTFEVLNIYLTKEAKEKAKK